MSTRSNLYRAARILGDIQAAQKGPLPYAKRVARKQVYRVGNRAIRRFTKGLGL